MPLVRMFWDFWPERMRSIDNCWPWVHTVCRQRRGAQWLHTERPEFTRCQEQEFPDMSKRTIHGGTAGGHMTPEYQAWVNMRRRCTRTDDAAYRWYLAKGITVCPQWQVSFEAFLADVGERPGPTWSLDRINTNKNYEPGNVRWATPFQQTRNRSNMRSRAHIMLRRLLLDISFTLGLVEQES